MLRSGACVFICPLYSAVPVSLISYYYVSCRRDGDGKFEKPALTPHAWPMYATHMIWPENYGSIKYSEPRLKYSILYERGSQEVRNHPLILPSLYEGNCGVMANIL
jgi:hypothetical protein